MQAWWQQTLTDYVLEPHHLKLLEAACDAWDRMVQARRKHLRYGEWLPALGGRWPLAWWRRRRKIA